MTLRLLKVRKIPNAAAAIIAARIPKSYRGMVAGEELAWRVITREAVPEFEGGVAMESDALTVSDQIPSGSLGCGV